MWSGRLRGALAAAVLALVVTGDLWSIDRPFFVFRGPPSEVFRDDPVTTKLRAEPKPFRVLDVGVYQGSYLMAHDIQTMLGYHGQEIRFYDELLGGKSQWRNVGSPALLDLLAFAICCSPRPSPCRDTTRCWDRSRPLPVSPAVLFERDTAAPFVRVVPGAAKLPDDQTVPTVIDPRFPYNAIALYPDTASGLTPEPIRGGQAPAPWGCGRRWPPGPPARCA